MKRDSMVYYRSFRDSLRELPPELYKSVSEVIFDYAFEGNEPSSDADPIAKALFVAIKPVIDSANARYEACVNNGKKGGAPKGSKNNPAGRKITNQELTKELTKNKPRTNLDVDVDVENKENKEKKRFRFSPPSLNELRVYISEKGLTNINPEEFIDHYTANGWMAGKIPMKDWKATLRNWNRRGFKAQTPTPPNNEYRPQYKEFD